VDNNEKIKKGEQELEKKILLFHKGQMACREKILSLTEKKRLMEKKFGNEFEKDNETLKVGRQVLQYFLKILECVSAPDLTKV